MLLFAAPVLGAASLWVFLVAASSVVVAAVSSAPPWAPPVVMVVDVAFSAFFW